jgi:hypothetical protein
MPAAYLKSPALVMDGQKDMHALSVINRACTVSNAGILTVSVYTTCTLQAAKNLSRATATGL